MRLIVLTCSFFLLAIPVGCDRSSGDSSDLSVVTPDADSRPAGSETAGDLEIVSADWPHLYGPDNNCTSPETGLCFDWSDAGSPPVAWSREIGSGYSAPVVADGRLIMQYRDGDEEVMACLDAVTGEPIWDHRIPTSFKCDYPVYSDGPYSTPLIHNETVFAQSAEGELRALDVADGTEQWVRDLSGDYKVPELGYGVGHSPLYESGLLIVNIGGSLPNTAVVALDPATGSTVWTSGSIESLRPNGSHATPVAATIHEQRLVFVVTSEEVLCLRPEDGTRLWGLPFGTGSRDTPNSTTPVVSGDLLLVSGFRANVFCLKIAEDGSYEELWENRRSVESCYNPLTCVDGHVYGWHSFDRTLRCVDVQTGHVQWKNRSLFERGNHVAVDGHLVILGEQGHFGCVRLDPAEYTPVFSTADPVIEAPCFTTPALANGRFYVRNEQQIVCLQLRSDNGSEDRTRP